MQITVAIVALALSAPTPAAAQQPDSQNVTVTARKKEVRDILKDVLELSGYDQVGRHEARICPGVVGAPTGTASVLIRLIRENAEAAGAKLDPAGCKPNAVLLFAANPAGFVTALHKRHPSALRYLEPARIRELKAPGAPIRSWHVVETRGRDGEMLGEIEEFNGVTLSQGQAKVVRNASATRTYENVRQDMVVSFALMDNAAVVGRTVQQLADVATLHLLVDLTGDAGVRAGPGSILSLFDPRPAGEAPPADMSAFDRGLLAGLYRPVRNNFRADQQRGRIAQSVKRAEAAQPAD